MSKVRSNSFSSSESSETHLDPEDHVGRRRHELLHCHDAFDSPDPLLDDAILDSLKKATLEVKWLFLYTHDELILNELDRSDPLPPMLQSLIQNIWDTINETRDDPTDTRLKDSLLQHPDLMDYINERFCGSEYPMRQAIIMDLKSLLESHPSPAAHSSGHMTLFNKPTLKLDRTEFVNKVIDELEYNGMLNPQTILSKSKTSLEGSVGVPESFIRDFAEICSRYGRDEPKEALQMGM